MQELTCISQTVHFSPVSASGSIRGQFIMQYEGPFHPYRIFSLSATYFWFIFYAFIFVSCSFSLDVLSCRNLLDKYFFFQWVNLVTRLELISRKRKKKYFLQRKTAKFVRLMALYPSDGKIAFSCCYFFFLLVLFIIFLLFFFFVNITRFVNKAGQDLKCIL